MGNVKKAPLSLHGREVTRHENGVKTLSASGKGEACGLRRAAALLRGSLLLLWRRGLGRLALLLLHLLHLLLTHLLELLQHLLRGADSAVRLLRGRLLRLDGIGDDRLRLRRLLVFVVLVHLA